MEKVTPKFLDASIVKDPQDPAAVCTEADFATAEERALAWFIKRNNEQAIAVCRGKRPEETWTAAISLLALPIQKIETTYTWRDLLKAASAELERRRAPSIERFRSMKLHPSAERGAKRAYYRHLFALKKRDSLRPVNQPRPREYHDASVIYLRTLGDWFKHIEHSWI
jgi:hypothetical protein